MRCVAQVAGRVAFPYGALMRRRFEECDERLAGWPELMWMMRCTDRVTDLQV